MIYRVCSCQLCINYCMHRLFEPAPIGVCAAVLSGYHLILERAITMENRDGNPIASLRMPCTNRGII